MVGRVGEWYMFRRLALISAWSPWVCAQMGARNAVRSGTIGCIRRNPASRTAFSAGRTRLASRCRDDIGRKTWGEHPMKVFRIAAATRAADRAGLRASARLQSDPGWALQDAGAKGSRRGAGQSLQGIAEENSGRQGARPTHGAMCAAGMPPKASVAKASKSPAKPRLPRRPP